MTKPTAAQPPQEDRLLELAKVANRAIEDFEGNGTELQNALGVLFMGQRFGWKVLYLIHDRKTIRKYQKILGIDIREEFPEVGDKAQKSYAFRAVQNVSNFWKAVRGEIKGIKSPNIGES